LADDGLILRDILKKIFLPNLSVITSPFIRSEPPFLQFSPTFMKPTNIFGISSGEWNAMSFYCRFEQIAATTIASVLNSGFLWCAC
jgi:hypothetical protein